MEVGTGPGRSAIAVIRLTGELAPLEHEPPLFRAANGRAADEQRINAICFGAWGDDPPEDVVFCRTSDNSTEVCCHGGLAAVERIVKSLVSRGFVRSAASTGEELWSVLTRARTQRTADYLLEQTTGLFEQELSEIEALPLEARRPRLEVLQKWVPFSRHLTTPWEVVLCGRPNVGKSSLMNAIAGFTRSIVSTEPGTTRDLVTLETAIEGWPVRLTDSAGLRDTSHPLELEGVRRARQAIAASDLALVVLDASLPLTPEDHELLALTTRRLVILHKSDLPQDTSSVWPHGFSVSSHTGAGIPELLSKLARELIPFLPPPGMPLPVTLTQQLSLT